MSGLLIGYARVSTDTQDLTAQRDGLQALGVPAERIYVDHGLTGTHRDRPGLREALAACRAGDTLVVTKPEPADRSRPDPSRVSSRSRRADEVPLERSSEQLDLDGHPLSIQPRDRALDLSRCGVKRLAEARRDVVGDRHFTFHPALAAAQEHPPV